MAKEKLGILKIKATFKNLLAFVPPMADILEDGKIGLVEMFSLAPILVNIPKFLENGKEALSEFADLEASEAKEVADYFASQFDIPNEELEVYIEKTIDLIAEGYERVLGDIQFVKNVKGHIEDYKNLRA